MGQQQLLLLVLGVVLVGLAVVVGIDAFEDNQRQFRQDQTIHLMMDIGAKAQLWKMTPPPLGGGDGTPEDNYSAFTLDAIGLEATQVQGSSEVIHRTPYACLKIFPRSNKLQINALDVDCSNGSWWMKLEVTGTGPDDVTVTMNGNAGAVNGNGQ